VEAYLAAFPSEFILFQCGTDSLGGDPITHLQLTEASHAFAARRLCAIADAQGHGRVLGMGGGGYNRRNLARGWSGVVRSFLESVA
jgi:acetoin utilization protein AcuC